MTRERTQLHSLTSLRFFAAAMIVAYHTLGIVWWSADAAAPFLLNQGVSFFFVLSGFVLHLTYRDAIEARELGYADFITRRFFRLWPAHVAALLLVVALAPAIDFAAIWDEFSAAQLFQIVFMLHALNPDIGVYYAINPPAWSISTEFLFYLLLPLISGLSLRKPGLTMAGAAGLIGLYLVFVASLGPDESSLTGFVYISPASRILEFVLGVYTCERWLRSEGTKGGTAAELGSMVAVAAAMYATATAAGIVSDLLGRTAARYVEVAFAAPAFAALIYVFAAQRGALSRVLSLHGFVVLGRISFALYLVHLTLLHSVVNLREVLALPVVGQVAVYAVVTLIVSWLGFRTIETWGIRLGKRIAARFRSER